MADFVAVIRRAVDGLSDNTPEMRVKVYARARGAVQRQLESMKPRPPETMLQRQLEKLEAAIRDVEAEHAEAGVPPAIAEEAAAEEFHAQPAEAYQQPEPVAEHVPEPEPEPEPVPAVHSEPAAAIQEEPAHIEEPAPVTAAEVHHLEESAHPDTSPTVDDNWRAEDDWQADKEPQPLEALEAVYEAPEHERYREQVEPVAVEPVHAEWQPEPETYHSSSVDEVPREVHEPAPDLDAAHHTGYGITETHSDPAHSDNAGHFDDVWAKTATPEPEDAGAPHQEWPAPAPGGQPAPTAIPVHYPPDVGFAAEEHPAARMPDAAEHVAWEAATFDDLPPVKSAPVAEAAPVKQVPPTPAGDFDDVDLFADVHGKVAKPAAQPGQSDGWNEIKELSGYEKFAAETDFSDSVPSDLGQVSVAGLQGKSYRMEPKRRHFGVAGILLTLAGVAVVAGGGYAAWMNRTALNEMVAGLVSSAPKNATVADKTATPAATTPVATKPTTPETPPVDDGNTVNSKFTQRLMADGSEVDAGVPPVPGGPVAAEGKSIAQQNVAAATPPPAATAANPSVPAPASAPPAQAPTPAPTAAAPAPAPAQPTAMVPSATPPAATQTATVGTGEKMFLYEERLGQTSPTAIEGTVTWSVHEDKGDDGKPSPTVQGSINVPERGMTALVTFKRNSDPSLPASHLIELVFSLPPNFEGGAIDSVQRVAMKATEQDRGDALIGVPAKITDDFHMVALNDFPDARKTNLDLLRNRNWIDIPITYRNGRRALLTMDKGTTGTDAFNKVIGEWAAIAGPSGQ